MKWFIYLYPKKWRERYGEEFVYILENKKLSIKSMADIFIHAMDARLLGLIERRMEMNNKLDNDMKKNLPLRMIIFTLVIVISFYGGYWLANSTPSILNLSPKLLLIVGVGMGLFLGYIIGTIRGVLRVIRMTQKEDIHLPTGKLIFNRLDI